ncbi:Eukaryotic translation initiation factor 2 subunit 2 [Bagarius yarrelli]|uniref:Eukaryotic translation initiation factor 2 subunit 2 n=1 Tax=Bagarius yarrelli TaxID=175774 RepID=A0A556U250_BAGYA|nr:Eukaryotic translation initiation factor 2 subunit 2 [Bagarius yarrelli]
MRTRAPFADATYGEEILFDPSTTKKKKKKKKPFMLDEEGDGVGEETQQAEPREAEPEAGEEREELKIEGEQPEVMEDDDLDLMLPAKKKKAKKLLSRVFNIMREKNPDMVAGEKRKFVMKPPQVVRVGTKKTSFVNFTDICKLLHRQPKHLLAFLLAELGTSGSIDGNNQLVIKGRFQQKQIENVLRRYIKEYVTCHTCRSPETILQKDTRLYFLQCETCHSRCSVASIKTGFQAVTGKRAQLRAKAN